MTDYRLPATSPYIAHAITAVVARCQERGMSHVAILIDTHLPGNGWRLEPADDKGRVESDPKPEKRKIYAVGPDLAAALLAELERQGLVI